MTGICYVEEKHTVIKGVANDWLDDLKTVQIIIVGSRTVYHDLKHSNQHLSSFLQLWAYT